MATLATVISSLPDPIADETPGKAERPVPGIVSSGAGLIVAVRLWRPV
jgi:hypothetical protein